MGGTLEINNETKHVLIGITLSIFIFSMFALVFSLTNSPALIIPFYFLALAVIYNGIFKNNCENFKEFELNYSTSYIDALLYIMYLISESVILAFIIILLIVGIVAVIFALLFLSNLLTVVL